MTRLEVSVFGSIVIGYTHLIFDMPYHAFYILGSMILILLSGIMEILRIK